MKKIKHEQPKRIPIAIETADFIEWVDMTPHQVLELLQRDVFPKFIHRKVIVNNPQYPEEEWALVNNGFIDLERRDEDVISFSFEGNVWVWDGEKHIPQENYKLPLVTFDLVKVGNKTKVEVTRGIVPDGFLERIMVALRDAVQPFKLLSAPVDRNKADAAATPQPTGINFSNINVGGNFTANLSDVAGGNQTTTTTATTSTQQTSSAAATHHTQRIQHLQAQLQEHLDLLHKYEQQESVEDDPRRLKKIQQNIAREKEAIKRKQNELAELSHPDKLP